MSLSANHSLGHRRYLLALLILGLLGVGIGILASRHRPYLRTYDAGNYVEVARNILAGRGFSSQVVSNFYQRYPQARHPEDRRASSWSLVLAGSLRLLGKNAIAIRLPNLLLGLLIVPLLVYFLGRTWRLAPVAAFGGAVLLVCWPHWLQACFTAQADVLFSCLTILILLAVAAGHGRIGWILVAGGLLGLAYTVKPAALFLVMPIGLYYVLSNRVARVLNLRGPEARLENLAYVRSAPAMLGSTWLRSYLVPACHHARWLAVVGFVAVGVASPILVRNYVTFGNPLYSTNLYTAGHVGFDDTGRALMRVYWDEQLPSLALAIRTYGFSSLALKVGRQLVTAGVSIFGGVGLFFVVPSLLVLMRRSTYPWLRLGWLALGLWVVELATLWVVRPRLLLPFMPVVTLTAAAGGLGLAQRFVRSRRHAVILLLGVVGLVAAVGVGGYCWWRHQEHIEVATITAYATAGKWIRDNLPANTVVMSHRPYLVRFHSDHPVVQIPFDRPEKIKQVIDHYAVGAVMVQQFPPPQRWAQELPRGELAQIVRRRGWRIVHEAGEVCVYAAPVGQHYPETF